MNVFIGENSEDSFNFSVDAMTCTTTFKGLKKIEQTNKLARNFMPVIIFSFFSQIGAEFVTELYDEVNRICSISRNVENTSVCLEILQKEKILAYVLKIS